MFTGSPERGRRPSASEPVHTHCAPAVTPATERPRQPPIHRLLRTLTLSRHNRLPSFKCSVRRRPKVDEVPRAAGNSTSCTLCNKCMNVAALCRRRLVVTLPLGPSKWVLVTVLVLHCCCCWIMSVLTTETCYCGLAVSCAPDGSPSGPIINYFLSLLMSHKKLLSKSDPTLKPTIFYFFLSLKSTSSYGVSLMASSRPAAGQQREL